MRNLIRQLSRITLALVTAFISIVLTFFCIFIIYQLTDTPIRGTEILVSLLAPLIFASLVSWPLFSQIKQLDQLENEMRALASFDALTQTLTRREFMSQAENYFKIAHRSQAQFTVLMIDIDFFKKINDEFGHAGGDHVLKAFGNALNEIVRESDLVGRYGGEEFVLLLWDGECKHIKKFTERLHKRISRMKLSFNNRDIPFTISIGVRCAAPDNVKSLAELIENADDALYHAKNQGRNQSVLYHELFLEKSSTNQNTQPTQNPLKSASNG